MKSIRIKIPGEPVAQGRPRFTTRGGFARAYDPAKSRNWKKAAAVYMLAARQAAGAGILSGPVRVEIVAVFKCPKDERVPHRRPHAKVGDVDNLAKGSMDAATGVLWADDKQVAELQVSKWIGAQGEEPRVEMLVTQCQEMPS